MLEGLYSAAAGMAAQQQHMDAVANDLANVHLDSGGRLVNSTGARVLPAITVPAGTSEDQVSIASDGTVNVAGKQIGRLRMITVRSPEGLAPSGSNLFTTTAASGPVRAA